MQVSHQDAAYFWPKSQLAVKSALQRTNTIRIKNDMRTMAIVGELPSRRVIKQPPQSSTCKISKSNDSRSGHLNVYCSPDTLPKREIRLEREYTFTTWSFYPDNSGVYCLRNHKVVGF
ncbi:hypothetical protein KL905_000244 [Ogataea polymorpha]|nr:hypothetical protein KL937_000832 [Ogataea polymorpha]KAG7912665.1 hypothetical protein KL907_000867 [Ogataea polymorpha]KAG7919279.1 hypothetical protein KL927_001408 [Ogataea polymorpha]KAG7924090.1 hypothetical protein KL905_000244 [Ogataea polymorpha]KAG7937163.1 hypothetical protein KL934_001366 [Ogataea polymorpha]